MLCDREDGCRPVVVGVTCVTELDTLREMSVSQLCHCVRLNVTIHSYSSQRIFHYIQYVHHQSSSVNPRVQSADRLTITIRD